MRKLRLIAVMLMAGLLPAAAQNSPRGALPAARPYKPVVITPATPLSDAGFDAMRKQLGEVARRKDRAALAKLVVAQGLLWWRENRDTADKRKSGVDNLAAALTTCGRSMITGPPGATSTLYSDRSPWIMPMHNMRTTSAISLSW